MTGLHLESLDEPRLAVFKKLRAFVQIGGLAGGTAIALQIGHRRSYDFDIFTFEPLKDSLFRKVKKTFGLGSVKTYESREQLNITTSEGVRVTFYYPDYQPKFKLVATNYIHLLDLRDLASNKALTIGKRGKWRDYADMYFLIKDGWIGLEDVISVSQERFGGEFSQRLFLQQLVYTADLDKFDIDFIGKEIPPTQIVGFFEQQARAYVEKKLR